MQCQIGEAADAVDRERDVDESGRAREVPDGVAAQALRGVSEVIGFGWPTVSEQVRAGRIRPNERRSTCDTLAA